MFILQLDFRLGVYRKVLIIRPWAGHLVHAERGGWADNA